MKDSKDLQGNVVDRVCENMCFLILLEGGDHALSGLFSFIEDRRTFRDLRHEKLFNRKKILSLLVHLEVAS